MNAATPVARRYGAFASGSGAAADRLSIRFQCADPEALPFTAGAVDVVLSSFGVMFAPHQVRAASELMRVCRHHGRIGLANWTPRGFIGRLFTVIYWRHDDEHQQQAAGRRLRRQMGHESVNVVVG